MTTFESSFLGRHSRVLFRGVASAEALIVVLFFFILWCSLIYVTRLFEARQNARLTARECAWTMAATGCGEVPPRCQGTGVHQHAGDPSLQEDFFPVQDEVSAPSEADGHGITTRARDRVRAEVEGLLFQRIRAGGTRPVQQPLRYGGRRIQVSTSYSLPCNSVPKSVGDLARSFFDEISFW